MLHQLKATGRHRQEVLDPLASVDGELGVSNPLLAQVTVETLGSRVGWDCTQIGGKVERGASGRTYGVQVVSQDMCGRRLEPRKCLVEDVAVVSGASLICVDRSGRLSDDVSMVTEAEVRAGGPFALTLSDASGRALYRAAFAAGEGRVRASVPGLRPGVYVLTLREKGGIATSRAPLLP